MEFILRLKGVDGEVHNGGDHQLNTSQIKFEEIFRNEISHKDFFEKTIKGKLESQFFNKQDSLVISLNQKQVVNGYTIFGDKNSIDGILGHSLRLTFDKVGTNHLASFKALSKVLGNSVINLISEGEKSNSGSIGLTMSLFEVYNDGIRDLLTNKHISHGTSSNFPRDTKDGRIRPTGLTQAYLSSLDQSLSLAKTAIRKISSKKPSLGCIVQLNLYELKRFNRLQSTRLTLADFEISQDSFERRLKNVQDVPFLELARFMQSTSSGKLQSSYLKSSRLNKLLFADIMKQNHFNACTVFTMDGSADEPSLVRSIDSFFSTTTNPKPTRSITPSSALSVKDLSTQLEKLKLELLDVKNKNLLLESENRQLTADLMTIEQETRMDVSNHYEKMVEEMNKNSMTTKMEDDELNQVSTDAKLENLAQHYDIKLKMLEDDRANLKLQLENLKYQNTRMDEIFHTEVTKITEEIREEFEQKFNQELEKLNAKRKDYEKLLESNDVLEQKIQLLQSQINVLKEKAGGRTEDAEKLYSKIKSLRLDDEVLMLINKKLKLQLGKEKKSKNLKNSSPRKSSSSPLANLNLEPKFKIFQDDEYSQNKRKLVRKDNDILGDLDDMSMI